MPYEGHPQKYYDMYAQTAFETVRVAAGGAQRAAREGNAQGYGGQHPQVRGGGDGARRPGGARSSTSCSERQLLDNTLVVFTGDNGFLLGRHGLWSKGLASDPINMYEEVMQVPMIWSWLGKVPAENTRPELVSFYDLLPSLCDATGAPVAHGRNLCGRSYLPARHQQAAAEERAVAQPRLRLLPQHRDGARRALQGGGAQRRARGRTSCTTCAADPRERVNQYDNPQFVNVRDRLRQ